MFPHAYILDSGRVIPPFDRPVGAMKVHNRPLAALQGEILAALGCAVERIDNLGGVRRFPCLVIDDDLYFTRGAMAGFLGAIRRPGGLRRGQPGNAGGGENSGAEPAVNGFQAALATSELTERFATAFQGPQIEGPGGTPCRAYGCRFLERFDPARPLGEQTRLLPIPHRRTQIRMRANRYFEPSGRFVLPISPVFMVPILHWASLVAANVVGMPGFFLHTLRQRPAAATALPLRMLLRAMSLRPSRLLGTLYLAGRGCQVHPTAQVEAALLGRHVRIGPGAVVRGCVLGNGTQIGPGAIIEGCTLGDEVVVNGNVVLRCVTADDRASMGSFFTQFSVLGADAVLCPDSGIFDFRFHGDVCVTFEGRTVPSGSRLLGGCLGDRAFLGPGVKLLAGQELPNGCILVPDPRDLVRGVDRELPDGVLRIDDRSARRALRRRAS
jgi:acetyltransferase-like isoleucine patch superfamily enzyme